MSNQGKFLCVEGPDGSGKTTQLEMLRNHLITRGVEVVTVREPGGTFIGEGIRSLFKQNFGQTNPMAEVYMMLAAKTQLWHEVIQPALRRGAWVITDRYTPSLYAYQGGGHRVSRNVLDGLVQRGYAGGAFNAPHGTVLLAVSREEQARRLMARASTEELDKIDTAAADFRERVYATYVSMGQRQEGYPVGVVHFPIDADRSPEEVHQLVLTAFDHDLPEFDSVEVH